MSKYIIELNDDVQIVQKVGVTNNGNAFSIGIYKDILEQYTPVDVEKIYDKAYRDGYNNGLKDGKQTAVGAAELREKLEYQKGFKDGKAQAERGCEGCEYEHSGDMGTPCEYCSNNFKDLWKAKDDKIVVGDEVTDLQSGANFVVTHLWKNNHGEMGISGFNGDCSAFSATFNKVKKTGRHFDIASILEDMRND